MPIHLPALIITRELVGNMECVKLIDCYCVHKSFGYTESICPCNRNCLTVHTILDIYYDFNEYTHAECNFDKHAALPIVFLGNFQPCCAIRATALHLILAPLIHLCINVDYINRQKLTKGAWLLTKYSDVGTISSSLFAVVPTFTLFHLP